MLESVGALSRLLRLKEPLVYGGGEWFRDEFETSLSYVETWTMHVFTVHPTLRFGTVN